MIKTLKLLATAMTLLAITIPANGYGYPTQDARTYILEKITVHDIVFMGTTHKQPAILDFIADLLPRLHTAGVTHIAIEVASDQQTRIDRYLDSGNGLADIDLHPALDCPRYRHLFALLRGIEAYRRPRVVAIDLPTQRYNGPIGRDAYMAAVLDKLLTANPHGKVLAVLGSFHVFRQLPWQRRIRNGHKAIRTLLDQQHPGLTMFSIVNILSQTAAVCDFGRRLGPAPGAVAVDMDSTFDDWRLGFTACLAIKPAPTWQLLDGIIVH
jgi:hypothetical protein